MELDIIAAKLEGLEETIIHRLIDRAQFRFNEIIYQEGMSGFEGSQGMSLLHIRLRYQEEMDALFGRYRQPEERPFCGNPGDPRRLVSIPDSELRIEDYDKVNLTKEIMESYIALVTKICRPGDDKQYGSSVVADVYALQAIAERVHYGSLYVAECKFQKNPERYKKLISSGDTKAITDALTRKEVEDKIMDRIVDKVFYIQAKVNREIRHVIDPKVIREYYRHYIIPLTKEGETRYLLNRII
ncbi:MAG: chorismate mutase [Spirochaetales bacterium]|nr:chorismate mutase [Spirochaetales bacterium]